MAEYKLEVNTGDMKNAGTWDHIFITLFGTKGQSERTELDNYGLDFTTSSMATYTIKTSLSLGKLLLVKVEKDPFFVLPEDEWYVTKIVVSTPEGDAVLFPCHRWISRGELVELRGGRAMKNFEEEHHLMIDHRNKELTRKKSINQWRSVAEGVCHLNSFNDLSELPAEVRFSNSKRNELLSTQRLLGIELKIKGLLGSAEKWESIEDMKNIFWLKKTALSDYITEHWKEDDVFGSQFLNAVNPNVIRRCSALPSHFPVTEEMVKPFLKDGTSLVEEIEKGNIFLYEQKKMDGIITRDYNGESLHVTAGLCLLYLNPKNQLMPIAIQLHQHPSEENPIFLPSDLETDWLLAKMFIKNADCLDHQIVQHLMSTHYLGEVFMIATVRCFAEIHPLYKSSLGLDGLTELMRRSLSEMTYSSRCLPENIRDRGLESVPNFYYRDDGLKLWKIINCFVKSVVEYYYPSDCDVCKDTELQEWICEIFTHGFLGNKASGFPACFHSVEEVIKFITMVIFTVTAQHAAVNNGQFDYCYWMPNGSLLLHTPPPATKGHSSMSTILEALPNVGETVTIAALYFLLSEKYTDVVPLGTYPDERFDEPAVTEMIKYFQAELCYLGEEITTRNSQLEVPYTYLHPTHIENSVTI